MDEIFLSASIPVEGRGDFYRNASPYLIQTAVRDLLLTTIGRKRIVFGGHPAITPMILAICEYFDADISHNITMYQSDFFKEIFPDENKYFNDIVFTSIIDDDRDSSLRELRIKMLSRPNIMAGIFIGGMEGIFEEYQMLKEFHPNAKIIALHEPGGAARAIFEQDMSDECKNRKMNNFLTTFHSELGIAIDAPRV